MDSRRGLRLWKGAAEKPLFLYLQGDKAARNYHGGVNPAGVGMGSGLN